MTHETVIVIPTIDERPNLEKLLPEVLAVLPGCGIVVVDDASRDGTAEFAEQVGRDTRRVNVLRREVDPGLGRAYVEGFRWVLRRTRARFIVQMDADGSHAPRQVGELVERARRGADLVVGSRYLPGAQLVGWDFKRRLLSRFGAAYARALTRLPLSDPTSGFKCLRRSVLETIDLGSLRSSGYAFQIELCYRAWRAGFRIEELPITFTEREQGRSKLTLRIAGEAAWRCWALRLNSPSPAAVPPQAGDRR
jgi:glycosyltransferase involved in cell wall biosynthesis